MNFLESLGNISNVCNLRVTLSPYLKSLPKIDFEADVSQIEASSILHTAIDGYFRTHYTHNNFVLPNNIKNAFKEEFYLYYDGKKILSCGINKSLKRFKAYFEIFRNLICIHRLFSVDNDKNIIYNPELFDDENESCIKYAILKEMLKYGKLFREFDIERECESLFNIITKLSIKFFKTSSSDFESKILSKDMRKFPKDWRWLYRCMILEYIKDHPNITIKGIAKRFGVNFNTVKKINLLYKENPLLSYDDLKEEERGPESSPFNKISQEILFELEECLIEKTPKDYDLPFSTWSAKCIQLFLKKEYNLDIKLKYLYYFLWRNNITSKFAQRRNPKQDLRKKKRFIKETYQQLIILAGQTNSKICFADETHVQQGYDKKGYAPRGKRTHISYSQTCKHTKFSLFTVAGVDGFFQSYNVEGTFTSESFIKCLEDLHIKYPNKKFLLILDNSHVHNSKEVKIWLEKLEQKGDKFVSLHFLPPYCPEINPVEFFNQEYKSFLKGEELRNSKEVVDKTNEYISKFNNANQETKSHIRSFFKAEECSYSIIQVLDYLYSE